MSASESRLARTAAAGPARVPHWSDFFDVPAGTSRPGLAALGRRPTMAFCSGSIPAPTRFS